VQLQNARLCLDCEEIHEQVRCPACASESFAFLERWVPAPAGARPPKAQAPPEAAVYRRLMVADAMRPKAYKLLKRGAIGLMAVSLARWAWRRSHEAVEPED